MRILGLDVGTSSVKAAVLDVDTAAPAGPVVRESYALDHPVPEAAEVPAGHLWGAVAGVARRAARHVNGIAGVGLSCMTPALVLLDAADQPLGPIWIHLDRRARPAARQVWTTVGQELLKTTGNRPLPGGITAVCWRQQVDQDPYLIRKTKNYLHLNSWLAFQMTGERAFDCGNACVTGLFGTMTDQKWSDRWCRYFEVEPEWLPAVVSGSSTVGTLRSAAAAELGVPAGLPVKLGTADTSSAMLAANMGPGDLLHVVGATQILAAFADRPEPDVNRVTRLFGIGSRFIYVSHNPVGGLALNWIRELCFQDQSEETFFHRTVPEAVQRRTIVTLDPPFLGGDRLEIEAHRAAFRDLTLDADRLDLLAAVLQAMQHGHRRTVAALGLADRFKRIFLTGGGASVVSRLLPEYAEAEIIHLEEGSLRGVAALFR
jgi:xylulokinase